MPQDIQADHQLELRKMKPQGRVLHNGFYYRVLVLPAGVQAVDVPLNQSFIFPLIQFLCSYVSQHYDKLTIKLIKIRHHIVFCLLRCLRILP